MNKLEYEIEDTRRYLKGWWWFYFILAGLALPIAFFGGAIYYDSAKGLIYAIVYTILSWAMAAFSRIYYTKKLKKLIFMYNNNLTKYDMRRR